MASPLHHPGQESHSKKRQRSFAGGGSNQGCFRSESFDGPVFGGEQTSENTILPYHNSPHGESNHNGSKANEDKGGAENGTSNSGSSLAPFDGATSGLALTSPERSQGGVGSSGGLRSRANSLAFYASMAASAGDPSLASPRDHAAAEAWQAPQRGAAVIQDRPVSAPPPRPVSPSPQARGGDRGGFFGHRAPILQDEAGLAAAQPTHESHYRKVSGGLPPSWPVAIPEGEPLLSSTPLQRPATAPPQHQFAVEAGWALPDGLGAFLDQLPARLAHPATHQQQQQQHHHHHQQAHRLLAAAQLQHHQQQRAALQLQQEEAQLQLRLLELQRQRMALAGPGAGGGLGPPPHPGYGWPEGGQPQPELPAHAPPPFPPPGALQVPTPQKAGGGDALAALVSLMGDGGAGGGGGGGAFPGLGQEAPHLGSAGLGSAGRVTPERPATASEALQWVQGQERREGAEAAAAAHWAEGGGGGGDLPQRTVTPGPDGGGYEREGGGGGGGWQGAAAAAGGLPPRAASCPPAPLGGGLVGWGGGASGAGMGGGRVPLRQRKKTKRSYTLAEKLEAIKMRRAGASWLDIAKAFCKPDPQGNWYNAIKMVKAWNASMEKLLAASELHGRDLDRIPADIFLNKQKLHPGKAPIIPHEAEKEIADWYKAEFERTGQPPSDLISKAQEAARAAGRDLKASSQWVKLFKRRWYLA